MDEVQRRIKLAIAEMGSEGSDMAIEVSVQYITKRDRGRVAYCCFHFTVRDDFGPKHAAQMLIKRNFSFPLELDH